MYEAYAAVSIWPLCTSNDGHSFLRENNSQQHVEQTGTGEGRIEAKLNSQYLIRFNFTEPSAQFPGKLMA